MNALQNYLTKNSLSDLKFPAPRPLRQNGITDWNYQPGHFRKPAHAENEIRFTADAPAFYRRAQLHVDQEISELKKSYGFPVEEIVRISLQRDPAVRSILRLAVPELHASFGADKVFNLEVSRDEDGSEMLYAIAVWPGSVQTAVLALRRFEEGWWLDQMAPGITNLAFTYEIV